MLGEGPLWMWAPAWAIRPFCFLCAARGGLLPSSHICGATDGEVCADLSDVEGYFLFRPGGRCDVRVRMYTLRTLIKEFEVEEGSVLDGL